MRLLVTIVVLTLTATRWAAAERPVVRVDNDVRVGISSLSFAKQTGEESLGNDLGRFLFGIRAGVGIETGAVSVLVDGSLSRGGLSSSAVSDNYFGDGGRPTAATFSIGAAAHYKKATPTRHAWLGVLRAGYSRMRLEGRAHLASLYMEIGGGVQIPAPILGLNTYASASATMRAERVRSFAVSGLTDGSVDPDDPALLLFPGVTLSLDWVF